MIDMSDAEKALKYLKSTDEEAARAKSYYLGLDDQKKTILAIESQKGEGSEAKKRSEAEASYAYEEHLKKLEEALFDWELIRNQRKSAELQIEMWRSINSNQRKGNV